MEKEFVPYELALKMKALGFDEPCFGWYEHNGNFYYCFQEGLIPPTPSKRIIKNCCLAPTFSQCFRWFRDEHKLWGYQIPWSGNMYAMTIYRLLEDSETVKTIQDRVIMNTWEEAELACLEKLISIVESKLQ